MDKEYLEMHEKAVMYDLLKYIILEESIPSYAKDPVLKAIVTKGEEDDAE